MRKDTVLNELLIPAMLAHPFSLSDILSGNP